MDLGCAHRCAASTSGVDGRDARRFTNTEERARPNSPLDREASAARCPRLSIGRHCGQTTSSSGTCTGSSVSRWRKLSTRGTVDMALLFSSNMMFSAFAAKRHSFPEMRYQR
jgi:hypothetical protein